MLASSGLQQKLGPAAAGRDQSAIMLEWEVTPRIWHTVKITSMTADCATFNLPDSVASETLQRDQILSSQSTSELHKSGLQPWS